MTPVQDDRIFQSTRLISAIIIPFLLLAFLILFLFPQHAAQRFAWEVKPPVMAAYIGAGYLGGAYLFIHALFGRRWHRVEAGFPAVTTFTISMLLATVLHWSRFDIQHFPFQLWLGLYLITPLLVPWMWLRNRVTDPNDAEAHDVVVPGTVRLAVRVLGSVLALIVLAGFVYPPLLIAIWPWTLTPLTARLLAGWGALIAVANLFIAAERRWSAWRVGVESIALWHLFFLVAAVVYRQDFTDGRLLNWYVLSVVAVLLLMGGLYVTMEARRPRLTARPQSAD